MDRVTRAGVLRTALCQVYTEPWAVRDNLGRTLAALDEAAAKGAALAITPECVLHGYAGKGEDYSERMHEVAEPADGETIRLFRKKAKEHQMSIVLGFAEEGAKGNIHNTAAYISHSGELVYLYRKVHCRTFESVRYEGEFTPGEDFYVADLDFPGGSIKLGTMICFDREVPEATRSLRSLGAEFIACPLATSTVDMAQASTKVNNEIITRCRAAENELFIAVVNHAGRFNGGSFLVGPHGEVLHQMGADAGVHVLDVPVGAIATEYHNNPLGWMGWGYRRPDVYGKYA